MNTKLPETIHLMICGEVVEAWRGLANTKARQRFKQLGHRNARLYELSTGFGDPQLIASVEDGVFCRPD